MMFLTIWKKEKESIYVADQKVNLDFPVLLNQKTEARKRVRFCWMK